METKQRFQTKIEQVLRLKVLRQHGITITDLATELGISRTTIYEIFNGKRKISRSLAFRLEEAYGESASFWMNLNVPLHSGLGDGSIEDRRLIYGPGPLSGPEIISFHESGEIGIEPFDEGSAKQVNYDLRVQKVLVENGDSEETKDIDLDQDDYDLFPGEIAFVVSKEKIRLPLTVLGHLGQIGELIHDGIIVEHGIGIDPGFKGRIACLIKNTGKQVYTLKKNTRFLSVEFSVLPVPPDNSYDGYGQDRNGFGTREKQVLSQRNSDETRNKNGFSHDVDREVFSSFFSDFSKGMEKLLKNLKQQYNS
ncbi:MAG: HigA family addiction module antitoxin [Desulfobacterales bacterium]|nr:HigA family addiction module antitoxin [Desulfobacterales bacterium]